MAVRLGKRDRAIYQWEQEVVHPWDTARLTESSARAVIDYVWRDMGLIYPPLFRVDPKVRGGYASRTEVVVGPNISHSLLFHEMAHSMDVSVETSTQEYSSRPEGESLDGSCHDDNWLGLYVNMLDRYLGPRLNKLWLMKTLHDRGLTMSLAPKVRCI